MKKTRPILWILIIAAVASAGYYGWQKFGSSDAGKTQTAQKGPPRALAVPVSVAPVQKVDFPVYLTGLGTVQGFNTVQVRPRVDGQIDRIAFTEGQIVKEGELLVSIDPRPYQAALDQAKAKKAQDEANLANANLELQRAMKLGEFAHRAAG
ncbi:multidrug efflux pump subunit AcrA (membrane-fusion protein) [Bradyrhizobium diazoefficiens]